jgi:hypothetical protein
MFYLLAVMAALCPVAALRAQTNTYPWPASGNVGIGTTAPVGQLDVSDGIRHLWINSRPTAANTGLLVGTDIASYANTLNLAGGIATGTVGSGVSIGYYNGSNWYGAVNIGNVTTGWGSLLLMQDGGNVGIGTPNPAVSLHVLGNVSREVARFQGSMDVSNNRNFLSLYTTNPSYWWELSNQDPSGGGSLNGLAFRERSASDPSLPRMYLATGGNVGIGTTNPQQLLDVAGTMAAREIIITQTGADYVFEPGYRLAPLYEVADYIRENHHLPDVPSAEEMLKNGASVGEMQAKLLAKVEELTLHMIDLEQKNQELEERLSRIKAAPAGQRKQGRQQGKSHHDQ